MFRLVSRLRAAKFPIAHGFNKIVNLNRAYHLNVKAIHPFPVVKYGVGLFTAVVFGGVASSTLAEAAADSAYFITKADTLYKNNEDKRWCLEYIKTGLQSRAGDPEVLWRYARALYAYAQQRDLKGKEWEREVTFILKIIQKALDIDDTNLSVLEWYGVALGSDSKLKSSNSALVSKSEDMYNKGVGDKKKTYFFLKGVYESAPNDVEVSWRYSRAVFDYAKLQETPAEERKQLIYYAHEIAKKALELDDKHFAVHKWYAITLTSVNDYQGYKEKIANAYKMRDHFEAAVNCNEKDGTCHHLLGLWHYNVAGMDWLSRNAAKMLFGTPPESTFEEALRHFENAEKVEPNFYSKNTLYVGLSLLAIGKKEEAKVWFEKVLTMPISNADDQEAFDMAKKNI